MKINNPKTTHCDYIASFVDNCKKSDQDGADVLIDYVERIEMGKREAGIKMSKKEAFAAACGHISRITDSIYIGTSTPPAEGVDIVRDKRQISAAVIAAGYFGVRLS